MDTTASDLFAGDDHDAFDDLLAQPAPAPSAAASEEDPSPLVEQDERDDEEGGGWDDELQMEDNNQHEKEERVVESGEGEGEKKEESVEKEKIKEVKDEEEGAQPDKDATPFSPQTSFSPSAMSSDCDLPPSSPLPTLGSVLPPNDQTDALFTNTATGIEDGPEGWLQDEQDDHQTVIPSAAPAGPSPPLHASRSPSPPPVVTSTDELFPVEDSPAPGSDDWFAEEDSAAGGATQVVEEIPAQPTQTSPTTVIQALPMESVLPQPTSPTVSSFSPIFPLHAELDPTSPPARLPSAPTMSDLFSSSEDTSDDWLSSEQQPIVIEEAEPEQRVEAAEPPAPADTDELFGSVVDDDLFGGLGERAAVATEDEQPTMAFNEDLSFDPSPPGTAGLSFDDDPADPYLALDADLARESEQPVADETDYSTQGYYDESGDWVWFDVVEAVQEVVVQQEDEHAVASPGGTWPSVSGSTLLSQERGADRLLRSPAVEQGAFEFGGLSESEARRTPLSSPFQPSQSFPSPVVDSQPPLNRSTSTNPYASGSSTTKTATTNPYATSNPYSSPAPLSLNPYSAPSANLYGTSSISSPYGLAPASSPNPYASPTSPNLYFTAPSAYAPSAVATPPKAAPPPFQRQTTQTYNAYDPPEMPIIPVRRAKPVAPPVGGGWGSQAPTSYASTIAPIIATTPKPAGPPPPPKRLDSWSQRPAPPPAVAPPRMFTPPQETQQPPLPKPFSPPPPRGFAPPPLKTFTPTPPAFASPPPQSAQGLAHRAPPPSSRAPPLLNPPSHPVTAFLPTMPSALGATPSLLASESFDEEDEGDSPRIARLEPEGDDLRGERRFLNEDDGGEGGGGNWNEDEDEGDEEVEVLSNKMGSVDIQSGRSSLDLPNGRPPMEAPSWSQPPPRDTTPSYARSVVSPPPGPPPRSSSTVSNASARYGAPPAPPPFPPMQLPLSDQGSQPYAASASASAPYARGMLASPPPRPPSASQGRNTRNQLPLASDQSTFAPPPPSHTPPPSRPASASNAYAAYGMSSSQASPPRNPVYSPVQATTSLPPQSTSNYGQPRNTSAPYDAPQSSRAPYASSMVAASVSSTSLHSQLGGGAPSAYVPDMVYSLAEDPLGRANEKFKKVPVMSFGFGGKVTICYPSLGFGGGYGGGYAGSVDADARDGRSVEIKALEDVVPESALKSSTASFPGPVFFDPATPRGATGDKSKKAAVLGYLDARAVEIEQGLGWLKGKGNEPKFRSEEGKAVLLRLLAVMVGNEGRLMGSAQVEDEVRAVLLPHLPPLKSSASPLLTPGLPVPLTMTSPSLSHNSVYSTSPQAQMGTGLPTQRNSLDFTASSFAIASSSSKPANLDHLQALLLRGEKKQAVHFATDEKMWGHALVISSCIDKQTWGEVVKAFARSELPSSEEGGAKGRDALRLTYEMFGGAGTATLARALPTVGSTQPLSSVVSVEPPPPTSSNSLETLANWREIVAMLVSNRSLGDTEALNELGDSLVAQGWVSAGHCCYILSAPTPPLDGLGSPVSPRIHLYGSSFNGTGAFEIDGVLITEIIEYALSLIPVLKGQEVYSGIAYLQSYKLLHAFQLAEVGDNATAQRYCEAIATSLKTCRINSPHHTLPFLNQLKELAERLSGTAQMDKSGASWISRTVSKPSLDSFGTWFEGRLTKFVAGDGSESPSPDVSTIPGKDSKVPAPIGPFSHFDAISPAPSQSSFLNRAASSANLSGGFPPSSGGNDQAFPPRSGSAMALRPGPFGMQPLDRSTSALDFTRTQTALPVAQPLYSADHARDSFDNAPYAPYRHSTESSQSSFSTYGEQIHSSLSPPAAPPAAEDSYWGSSNANTGGYDEPSEHNTPRANSFEHGQQWGSSSYGIDTSGNANETTNEEEQTNDGRAGWGAREEEDGGENDDDLGLGNSKGKKAKPRGAGERADAEEKMNPDETPKGKEKEKEKVESKDAKPAASTGWLGRLWGAKKEGPSANAAAGAAAGSGKPPPIKAKLGEESAFYYDKDLKKWVNKKAGPEDATASRPPPPPPSRSQTVSPSRAHRPPASLSAGPSTARLDGSFPSAGPPSRPPSAFSAPHARISSAPSTRPPTGPPSRVHSSSGAGTPPPSLPGVTGSATPPPAKTAPFRGPVVDQTAELMARTPTPTQGGSAAARKKNLRSRYVDVFEQT